MSEPSRSMKRCPFCAEDVLAEAIKCRYCGSDLRGMPSRPRTETTDRFQALSPTSLAAPVQGVAVATPQPPKPPVAPVQSVSTAAPTSSSIPMQDRYDAQTGVPKTIQPSRSIAATPAPVKEVELPIGVKALGFFVGWILGWSWVPIFGAVASWFFFGISFALFIFLVTGGLLIASSFLAVFVALLSGHFTKQIHA